MRIGLKTEFKSAGLVSLPQQESRVPIYAGGPTPAGDTILHDLGKNPFDGINKPVQMSERPKNYDSEVDAAKKLLAEKLVVVKSAGAATAPNHVTAAELEEMARAYAGMKNGWGPIRLDGSAEFKTKVLADMAKIMETKSGRELIHKIGDTKLPQAKNLISIEDSNAQNIRPKNDQPQTLFVDQNGEIIYDSDADKTERKKPAYGSEASPGSGLPSIVLYAPGKSVSKGTSEWAQNQPSDILLFHELVHAYHHRSGTLDYGKPETLVTPEGLGEIVSRAETQATGLGSHAEDTLTENAYRAEKRALGYDAKHRHSYDATL